MITEKIEVFVKDEPWRMTKAIYVVRRCSSGKTQILINDIWVELQEGEEPKKVTLRLENDIFQKIIDALSQEIKPTAVAEVDAELKATKLHLKDMRDLVFFKEMGKQQ